MAAFQIQFEGAPCLQHSSYVFYKAFKYNSEESSRILCVGDFFFLKILQEIPVCIGEIELLWVDKASNQLLASLKLYFRPEHTPDGRHDDTGEDEVVVLGERLVLRLDDLIPLIQENARWTYGSTNNCSAVKKQGCGGQGDSKKDALPKAVKNGNISAVKAPVLEKDETSRGAANVAIMSYPRYCRYRAMMKRLENCENEWLHLLVVKAIGGFTGHGPGCRVMYCRDSFYHSDIDDLDIRMDHMLPALKGRIKTKKTKQLSRKDSHQDSDSMEEMFANITPSISTSSRPRRSTECTDLPEDKVSTEEQAFLIGLHKFMHDAKMPIGRIPSLGFKQIDLYYFYKQAEKLGGYDLITTKRMWKHLYDKLGGNSSNTSAATCTRRHYERLLLPYERYLRKLKGGKPKKRHKHSGVQPDEDLQKQRISDSTNHKENVEIKDVNEVKEEIVDSVESDSKVDIKRKTFDENMANVKIEAVNRKGKLTAGLTEHSNDGTHKGSELLEVPNVRHRTSAYSPLESKSLKSDSDNQNLMLRPGEQPKDQEVENRQLNSLSSSSPKLSVQGPGLIGSSQLPVMTSVESPVIPYTNLMYQGGYLVPVLPQHLLQPPWGVLASSASSLHAGMDEVSAALGSSSNEFLKSNTFVAPSRPSKPDQRVGRDSSTSEETLPPYRSSPMPSSSKQPTSAHSRLHTSSSSSNGLKAAHTNTPYKPSPYLLQDHIQPLRTALSCSSSSGYSSASDLLGHTSHSLAPILHPTPPGHKRETSLPPAPSSIYLHPTSTNPFSPLPTPVNGTPPLAHNNPHKRSYPFENPVILSPSVFPSPDMVLDRIKNFTGLPRSNVALAKTPGVRQRFDSPHNIFRQTPQSYAAGQNSSASQPPKHSQSQSQYTASNNTKHSNSKSKTSSHSRKNSQLFSPAGSISSGQSRTALELQQSLMQQQQQQCSSALYSSNSKMMDQLKPASTNNGMLQISQHPSKTLMPSPQASPVASSSKDGRLTSALFGAQFTAMPRSTKALDQVSGVPAMPEPPTTASAMGLSSHLHPAFMSPFMPAGASPAAAALSPQLQMLAGGYGASPSHLAAYEELLRQNGYGPFYSPVAPPPAKAAKKN